MESIKHPWGPVYDRNSKILILGTMPSPKSREMQFYYGHPQNIFWKTLADLLNQDEPQRDVEIRRRFLLENKVALWDVLAECEIDGASDASIKNAKVNKFRWLLEETSIQAIFTTGKAATDLFHKNCESEVGKEAIYLPSTSPANRGQQAKPEFLERWNLVKKYL